MSHKSLHYYTTGGGNLREPRGQHSNVLFFVVPILAVVILGLTAAVLYVARKPERPRELSVRAITDSGIATDAALSRDGKRCAYATYVDPVAEIEAVFVSDLKGGAVDTVFQGTNISNIRWSTNGEELLMRASMPTDTGEPAVYVVPLSGGAARRYDIPGATFHNDVAWYPGGLRFVAFDNADRLIFVNKRSGDTNSVELGVDFADVRMGEFSSDGRRLVFTGVTVAGPGAWLYDDKHKSVQGLREGAYMSLTWAPGGAAIYALEMTDDPGGDRLWKINIDPSIGVLDGEPQLLLQGMPYTQGISVSRDGKRLLCAQQQTHCGLHQLMFNREGRGARRTKELVTEENSVHTPALSPDGRYLAYTKEGANACHVWAGKTGGQAAPVTAVHGEWYGPSRWSPDGRRLAVVVCENATNDVASRLFIVDQLGPDSGKITGDFLHGWGLRLAPWLDWPTPDTIMVWSYGALFFINPRTEQVSGLVDIHLADSIYYPRLSPDARQVALSPDGAIVILSLADRTFHHLTDETGEVLGWSRDGQWVNYMAGDHVICRVNTRDKRIDTLVNLPDNLDFACNGVALSDDGSFAVYENCVLSSDVVLIENFDPPSTPPAP